MVSLKTFFAKFSGTCAGCGGAIRKGEKIAWSRETGAYHFDCRPSADPEADSEYWKGRGDGERFQAEKKIYGRELAEAFAAEDEYNRFWKYGEDY